MVATSHGRPPLPLTAQQRARLLHDRRWRAEGGSRAAPHQVGVTAVRLRGSLDVGGFALAVGDVVGRHEALRVRLAEQAGEWVQVVDPSWLPQVGYVNLADLDEAARREWLRGEADRSFDLEVERPARFLLARLGAGEHAFLAVVDRSIWDGAASRAIFMRDLASSYRARREGSAPRLVASGRSYSDFVREQHAVLSGPRYEELLRFWARKLAGCGPLPALDLVGAPPRPATLRHGGRASVTRLDPTTTARVREQASSLGATPFTFLMTALVGVLSHRTRSDDVAVITPTSPRGQLDLLDEIGPFSNLAVLRVGVDRGRSLRALCDEVTYALVETLEHQDMPFDELVRVLAPDKYGQPWDTPAVVATVNAGFESWVPPMAGLSVSRFDPVEATACSVSFWVVEDEAHIELVIEDEDDWLPRDTPRQLLGGVAAAADRFARDPDTPVDRLAEDLASVDR